jgi:hypothetical protein
VEVERESVRFSRLSECQADARAGQYAAALAGFVRWLAREYETVRGRLDAERAELRDSFLGRYAHARTPDALANVLIGLRYVLRYAEAVGAIDSKRRDELWARGGAAFRTAAGRQGEHQRAHDPVARFGDLIQTLLSSGRAHVAGPEGGEPDAPPAPEFWGWEGREFRSGPDDVSTNWTGGGEQIGWVEGDELYLSPDATFAGLVELTNDQGTTFPVSQDTLYRRLREAGLLLRHDSDRTTTKVILEGSRRRVLVFSAARTLSLSRQPGQPGQAGPGDDGPEEMPRSAAPVSDKTPDGRGTTPGLEAPRKSHKSEAHAPTAPVAPVSVAGEGARYGQPGSRLLFDQTGLDALRR